MTDSLQYRKTKKPNWIKRNKVVFYGLLFPSFVLICLLGGIGAYFNFSSKTGGPTVAVIGEDVNCRSEPSKESSVVRTVSGYTEFGSNSIEGDWVNIGVSGQSCWVNATYVIVNSNLKATSGQQPRLGEYLKRTTEAAGSKSLSRHEVANDKSLFRSIVGVWGRDVNECAGSDTALEFQSDGVFWGYGLGNARWVEDGRGVLVRWGKYEGDDMNEPHDAGQSLGVVEWLAPDRISIDWQPYGDQDWATETLVRCP